MSRPYDREAWAKARAAAPMVSVSSGARTPDQQAEALARYVDGHIANAKHKPLLSQTSYLTGWANFIDRQIGLIAIGRAVPPHFQGLDAITLANARDRLLAAIKETE
jgi:hypothetical protein